MDSFEKISNSFSLAEYLLYFLERVLAHLCDAAQDRPLLLRLLFAFHQISVDCRRVQQLFQERRVQQRVFYPPDL